MNHSRIGHGSDVLLLHGWGGDRNSFSALASLLKNGFCVTTMDLYGFGDTPHPDRPLKVDDYVNGVLELIHTYSMKNVTLVCHSFGARVGIKLAALYPQYVLKLIITDGAGLKPRRGVAYYAKVYYHKLLTRLRVPHSAGSDDYKKLRGTMRETFKNVVNEDLTEYLGMIRAHTLLIWGNKDRATPIYMAKKIHSIVRGSILVVMKGEGHFAYITRSDLFCDLVEQYIVYGEDSFLEYYCGDRSNRDPRVVSFSRTRAE